MANLPKDHPVQQIADMLGGKVEDVMHLPDGSGGATVSYPLPADHWLTAPGENIPPMPWRMGNTAARNEVAERIRAAGRYAVRCATMNGGEDDFDPDALLQNLVVGMLGYWTADGLSHLMGDPHDNPDPVPPLWDGIGYATWKTEPCCQQFDTCEKQCVPLVRHLRERLAALDDTELRLEVSILKARVVKLERWTATHPVPADELPHQADHHDEHEP